VFLKKNLGVVRVKKIGLRLGVRNMGYGHQGLQLEFFWGIYCH